MKLWQEAKAQVPESNVTLLSAAVDAMSLNRSKVMIEKLELAKDLIESLAARKIGGTGYLILSSEENDLVYEIFNNDYIIRNDQSSVDMKLPFDVMMSLREVS